MARPRRRRKFLQAVACFFLAGGCGPAHAVDTADVPVWLERWVNPAEGNKSLRYRIYTDGHAGDTARNEVVVNAGQAVLWKYEAPGRGLLFSWSPRGTALLVGTVHPERDQSLQVVLVTDQGVRAVPILLDPWRRLLQRELPHLAEANRAARSQVDFDHVEWSGEGRVRFWYRYVFQDQAGEILLEADLAGERPIVHELRRTSGD